MKQFSVENLQTLSNHDETLEIQDTLKFLGKKKCIKYVLFSNI